MKNAKIEPEVNILLFTNCYQLCPFVVISKIFIGYLLDHNLVMEKGNVQLTILEMQCVFVMTVGLVYLVIYHVQG